MPTNKAWTLASRPAGGVGEENFKLVESEAPRPKDGEVLVRNQWLSLDPYMRGRMNDVKSYVPPVQIGEALHTYLQISDIGSVNVVGLEGATYHDKVDNFATKKQGGAIGFDGEVDRVYVNTPADCVIVDQGLKRRIRIAKTGSQSTIVWTPWTDKAEKMGDMGRGKSGAGWREMVCVESANAMDNVVTVAPGETHTMTVTYSVEPL